MIPFYFDIAESKIWYPDLTIQYYHTFISQYISLVNSIQTFFY
ncbi:hypothetical protein GMMP15_660006 [Candidatus Magnetomoraceae bacterium gMMP-15]